MRNDEFEPLAQPHLGAVLRVASVMVGSSDAEDVAQEAITNAWRRLDSLRDPAAARAWLLRITLNTCLNWRRARNIPTGRYPLSLDAEPEVRAQRDGDPGASDHAGRLDLRQALAALEPESQQVVALRYFAGLDSTEIGAMLGIPAAIAHPFAPRADVAPPAAGRERGDFACA
ncbi:MAG TPA: sigma-70 family RNA polymerase sigma factor [Ktedonobacterales bacterium]